MSRLSIDKIEVRAIKAFYDDSTQTEVKETSSMLFYKTQTFYCHVDIELPNCITDRDWTIGLVQACDMMHLSNNYNDTGKSLWEFHPLKSGLRKMINDSDGRQYPFYSINQSLYTIKRGPLKRTNFNLQIKDYFHPSVVWELPYSGGVQLTEINRHQKFLIWLIAIKHGKKGVSKEELFILKKIRWVYDLLITVDPYMPLGDRVRRIYDIQDNNIIIIDPEKTSRLPTSAACPPHCNAAQSLIWYPKDPIKHARILVPPKQIIVSWDNWVKDMLGHKARVRKPSEVVHIQSNQSSF